MVKYITYDVCGKECPPFDQARRDGWYLSSNLSVSGIPWDMMCPDCLKEKNKNRIILANN